jgi:hypothetical protein
MLKKIHINKNTHHLKLKKVIIGLIRLKINLKRLTYDKIQNSKLNQIKTVYWDKKYFIIQK